MKRIKLFFTIVFASLLITSCTKYKEIGDANFSDQQIYMPAAVEGNATSGIYSVNKVATPGLGYRYTADVAGKKLTIPLAVYRSGATTKGTVNVSVAAGTDTISKLLLLGKLPAGTEVLTAGKFTLPPMVTIADGGDFANINLVIDLDFLLANVTKKYAIGVSVSSADRKTSQYATTVVLIDPAFLVPTANFTTSINSRTVNFSNTSVNAATYAWDYGDGTAVSTGAALPHTYAAAGTYTIKLVSSGALGDYNKATATSTIVIP